MSLYTCYGNNPQNLEEAEKFKQLFLKFALEERVLISPQQLDNTYSYHFGYDKSFFKLQCMYMGIKQGSFREFHTLLESELQDLIIINGNTINYTR